MTMHCLHTVMYHYVRDPRRTEFPQIHALPVDEFRQQVEQLSERFEMATLESAVAFLDGRYRPRRDLCLLTFDDGLKDHFTHVFPVLAPRRIQGLFFLITGCLEQQWVATVHKNHYLMATLEFADYRRELLAELSALSPQTDTRVDPAEARRNYRWDTDEVAALKFLLNFRLPAPLRAQVLDRLFARTLGDEPAFARQLYLSWDEARQMQAAGMLMGGHSHRHEALATLDADAQRDELEACRCLLTARLKAQPLWPFSYPYGKPVDSYNDSTVRALDELGFACAFSTVVGSGKPGSDLFAIRRIDAKDVRRCVDEVPCHPERSEGSGVTTEEILRCAQDDLRRVTRS